MEEPDLLELFFSDADVEGNEKEELDTIVNIAPTTPTLRRLILTFAEWCYELGYAEGHEDGVS